MVQVLCEPGKAAHTKSYMWVYRSGEFQKQPVVLYDYQPGRGQVYPKTYLKDYCGYLLTDGYAAYNTLGEDIIVTGCWAHARRKFHDAQKIGSKKSGSTPKGATRTCALGNRVSTSIPTRGVVTIIRAAFFKLRGITAR